jgi:hypothetical protein
MMVQRYMLTQPFAQVKENVKGGALERFRRSSVVGGRMRDVGRPWSVVLGRSSLRRSSVVLCMNPSLSLGNLPVT